MAKFRLKTLNFWLLLFLFPYKANKCAKIKNTSERAKKAKPSVTVFKNFLSILNLPINLNFERARFEFDLSRLNICVSSQNLEFLIITFLVVLRTNSLLLLSAIVAPSSLWLLELQKLGKHKKDFFRKRFVSH